MSFYDWESWVVGGYVGKGSVELRVSCERAWCMGVARMLVWSRFRIGWESLETFEWKLGFRREGFVC